jgi:putative hydrolase of the HAD superfamily
MPLCGVRAVVFDAVGTLIFPNPAAPVVYTQVGSRYGSQLNAESIRPRFQKAFRAQDEIDRRREWRTSEERERARWRYIVANVLTDVVDPDACFHALFDHFSKPDAWRCDPSVSSILPGFAKNGLMLGLASNYDSRLRSVLAGKPDLAAIQMVCISSEIGWRKPSPKFFEAICHSAGVPPDNIVFVGDDFENDIEGALQAGLRPVWLRPENSLLIPKSAEANQGPCIGRLKDLLPILNQA